METNLNTFLVESKACINHPTIDLVVMGNEAADLDSMASAIAFAYLQTVNGHEGTHIVPLMPIHRADLKLRAEIIFVFEQAKINPDHLVFLDDIHLPDFFNRVDRLALVDHNKLSTHFETWKEKTDIILDHHKDQGLYPHARTRIIEPLGSCATLVGEILGKYPDLGENGLSILLGSAILLDTINLDPAAGRVTTKDRIVARQLFEHSALDLDEYFKKLQNTKFSTQDLTTLDLLRKDYKEFRLHNLLWGIASTPLSIKDWQDKDPDLCLEFDTYARARHLDVLITMNAYEDKEFKRDIGMWCPRDFHDPLITVLKKMGLGLKSIPTAPQALDTPNKTSFFTQNNTQISRKKLVPLLTNYFQDNALFS